MVLSQNFYFILIRRALFNLNFFLFSFQSLLGIHIKRKQYTKLVAYVSYIFHIPNPTLVNHFSTQSGYGMAFLHNITLSDIKSLMMFHFSKEGSILRTVDSHLASFNSGLSWYYWMSTENLQTKVQVRGFPGNSCSSAVTWPTVIATVSCLVKMHPDFRDINTRKILEVMKYGGLVMVLQWAK